MQALLGRLADGPHTTVRATDGGECGHRRRAFTLDTTPQVGILMAANAIANQNVS